LRNLQSPVVAHIEYIGGPSSSSPGQLTRRLLLVTATTDTTIEGHDFTRDGEYRRFRRDPIVGAKVLGALLPIIEV